MIERTSTRGAQELLPFGKGEYKYRSSRVFAVPDTDLPEAETRDFDAIPRGAAVTALEPTRIARVGLHVSNSFATFAINALVSCSLNATRSISSAAARYCATSSRRSR